MIERKFWKLNLGIHLVIIQPKTSKNVKNPLKILNFCGRFLKIEGKFGKFCLNIHLALTYPKPSKKGETHWKSWICWKIPQNLENNWEISSWYPFSPNIPQNFKKKSKTIKNLEFCWKIPQNWEKIWEISSWYPYSHYTAKNAKKCQYMSKIREKI